MTSKPVLTPREAAELLGVGYKTYPFAFSKRADFPAFRVGERKIMVSAEGLREWEAAGKMAETP